MVTSKEANGFRVADIPPSICRTEGRTQELWKARTCRELNGSHKPPWKKRDRAKHADLCFQGQPKAYIFCRSAANPLLGRPA